MRVLLLIVVLWSIILAEQNLVAVSLPSPIVITAERTPIVEPMTTTDELLNNRRKFIPVEQMSYDALSPDVPKKEANPYWRDFTRCVDNLHVVNSVKNRKRHIHSTTEYLNGGFALHEGTHHLLPILLRIMVGFNNNNNTNTDVNFIAFKLPSSLAQGYQSTDTFLLLVTMTSMIFAVEYAIAANTPYRERRVSYTTSILVDHLFHQDSTDGDGEKFGRSDPITDTFVDHASFNATASDILPYWL